MTLSLLPPLADAADFPAPRVPMTPYLEARRLLAPRAAVLPALAARGGILTVSGRAALGLIARQLIRAGDRVLLPAYHCPSLVEPFLAAGAAVDYYHVDATLNPKFDDFRQRLAVGARVVVFVHMFGFRQDTAACEVLARAAGASVVQDCAHALYALPGIAPTDYGIASLVKFCEVEEGGLLLAPRDLKLTAPHAARAMRDNLSDRKSVV